MATFVLIHGGGDVGWYWHLVERELRLRGHDTLAPDLPCDDDSTGLAGYADTVIDAAGDRGNLVVAAQSFGGFTAPLVAARIPVTVLALVAGMIPAPGEAPEDWPANTGFDQVIRQQAQRYAGQDLIYHDVPPGLAEQARRRARDQSDTPGHAPWPLDAWPPVPTRFVLCTEDRFFPPEFMRRVVADRLGIVPDEIAGDRFDAAERALDAAREQRAQGRGDRYAARQAYERASATADRLARRVRDLAEGLDLPAELAGSPAGRACDLAVRVF